MVHLVDHTHYNVQGSRFKTPVPPCAGPLMRERFTSGDVVQSRNNSFLPFLCSTSLSHLISIPMGDILFSMYPFWYFTSKNSKIAITDSCSYRRNACRVITGFLPSCSQTFIVFASNSPALNYNFSLSCAGSFFTAGYNIAAHFKCSTLQCYRFFFKLKENVKIMA